MIGPVVRVIKFEGVASRRSIVIRPVRLPLTDRVSTIPDEKLASICSVLLPAIFPVIVKASPTVAFRMETVPAMFNCVATILLVPEDTIVAAEPTFSRSQFLILAPTRVVDPALKLSTSIELSVPVSSPPSRIAVEAKLPPENVKTSTPPPNDTLDPIVPPVLTRIEELPSSFLMAVPLAAVTVPLFKVIVVDPPSVNVSMPTLESAPVTFAPTTIAMSPLCAVMSIPSSPVPVTAPDRLTVVVSSLLLSIIMPKFP